MNIARDDPGAEVPPESNAFDTRVVQLINATVNPRFIKVNDEVISLRNEVGKLKEEVAERDRTIHQLREEIAKERRENEALSKALDDARMKDMQRDKQLSRVTNEMTQLDINPVDQRICELENKLRAEQLKNVAAERRVDDLANALKETQNSSGSNPSVRPVDTPAEQTEIIAVMQREIEALREKLKLSRGSQETEPFSRNQRQQGVDESLSTSGVLSVASDVAPDPQIVIEETVVTRTQEELKMTKICPLPQRPHTGPWKGIQGHNNSCYLDATLFAMFAYSSFYDCMLDAEWNGGDQLHSGIRNTLRDCVVNVLRERGVVYCDKMTELRELLDKLGSQVKVSGIASEQKDPEEVLNLILTRAHGLQPFVNFIMKPERSDREIRQDCFLYQIFIVMDKKLNDPTVQQLLEISLHQANLTMCEVPNCLMLQTPRYGCRRPLFDRILPKSSIDVTHLISVRPCKTCGMLATLECRAAFWTNHSAADTTFCSRHFRCSHMPPVRPDDPVHKLNTSGACAQYQIKSEHLTLTAILCIETCRYVAFVRTGRQLSDPWVFFDSMAEREGRQNIPHVTEVPWFNSWLDDPLGRVLPRSEDPQHHQRRILIYAYMYIYHNFKSCA